MLDSKTINSADNTSILPNPADLFSADIRLRALQHAKTLNRLSLGQLTDVEAETMARLGLDSPVAFALGDVLDMNYILDKNGTLQALRVKVLFNDEYVFFDTERRTLSLFPVTDDSTVPISAAAAEDVFEIFENFFYDL